MNNEDIKHMAFVLIHGGFNSVTHPFDESSNGGCSCATCCAIRSVAYVTRQTEAEQFIKNLRERSEHA